MPRRLAPSRASRGSKAPRQPWQRVCVSNCLPPADLHTPSASPMMISPVFPLIPRCTPSLHNESNLPRARFACFIPYQTRSQAFFALLPFKRSYAVFPSWPTSYQFKRYAAYSPKESSSAAAASECPSVFPKPISTLVPGLVQTERLSPPHRSTDSSQREGLFSTTNLPPPFRARIIPTL